VKVSLKYQIRKRFRKLRRAIDPNKKARKTDQLSVKTMNVQDWRGLVALTTVIGGFALIALAIVYNRMEAAAIPAAMMMIVVSWYFQSKSEK